MCPTFGGITPRPSRTRFAGRTRTLIWNSVSGSGNDSATLESAATDAGENWNVNVFFGTGNDTLTPSPVAPATQFIIGLVDCGGPGGNTCNQGPNWDISGLTLQNE